MIFESNIHFTRIVNSIKVIKWYKIGSIHTPNCSMLEIQINSLVLNWNDFSYKAIAQTVDFVTSQFSFELLALVLYPFSKYMSTTSCFFLLELVPLNKISLIFQTCALTNYNFQAKKKKKNRTKHKFPKQKLAQTIQTICISVYFNSIFTDTFIIHISF